MIVKDQILENVSSKKYTVKIANSDSEVQEALSLRYEVFKKELHRDFDHEGKIEKDPFDDQSHHLIVKDNDENRVIGTYRLQSFDQAENGLGFVSNKRFHLEQMPDEILRNGVEVGRACIEKNHRSGRILFLLWKGFAGYLTHYQKRYLFGYSAFDSTDTTTILNTFSYINSKGWLHPDIIIEARKPYRIDKEMPPVPQGESDMPPLMKNYIDVGCKICSKPSQGKNGLAHCMILLDLEEITERTRKLFFG